MSDLTVEATGETVSEAKWAALRELEQRHPALDKTAVRFEVVSEGERGLLGVGYEPARVVAHLPAEAAASTPIAAEEGQAGDARGLVSRIVSAFGIDGSLDVDEGRDTITITVSGADAGVLIGNNGKTIDAVQYLLNVIQYRTYGDAKKDVVVDADGYRERRRATLVELADEIAGRVRESGQAEELEPMTSVERKVIHLHLKEAVGVATSSEGAEPNRYVVVLPD
jgi:spoIIIJ-associated protein